MTLREIYETLNDQDIERFSERLSALHELVWFVDTFDSLYNDFDNGADDSYIVKQLNTIFERWVIT